MNQSPALPRRLAALIYDAFLLLPLIMALTALAAAARFLLLDGVPIAPPWLVRILALIAVAAFYCYFWRKSGQTLGMQAWRIRLRRADGGPVSLRCALLRCLAGCLSLAAFGLGFLWCLIDREGRTWHGRLSGTRLEMSA